MKTASQIHGWARITFIVILCAAEHGAWAAPPVPATLTKRTAALDEPLRLLAVARQAYGAVHDYSCTVIKRERVDGQLQPDHIIAMRARTQPFSVYLKWFEPKKLTGQEVCYVAGRNDGKMRVKSTGLLGVVGFVSLEPADPRALKTSNRSITEAGIGNLIERVGRAWEAERRVGQPVVRVGEFEYNKRRCIRVETINSGKAGSAVPCGRSLIYFDKENKLPIRIECYGWPKPTGQPGDLIETYSFVNLKLNAGLGEELFNH